MSLRLLQQVQKEDDWSPEFKGAQNVPADAVKMLNKHLQMKLRNLTRS